MINSKYLPVFLGVFSLLSLIAFVSVSVCNKEEERTIFIILSLCFLALNILLFALGLVFSFKVLKNDKILLGVIGLFINLITPAFILFAIVANSIDLLHVLISN